ncbi:MAG: DEAD/DEAH box helicase [Deltaproteobacteria bacterium]|nr:DEAD/DEAH box helicase [Deltaproteobacteria bacterium]
MEHSSDVLSSFQPDVRGWFEAEFPLGPTPPQVDGWAAIKRGRDVLIAAPTGSGKTLAAFLSALDELVAAGLEGPLPDATMIVYVSPLKALANDVEKNLLGPLRALEDRIRGSGRSLAEIRVAVRSGDTTLAERERHRKRPPHVLITTPESFYILLTASKSRESLGSVRTLIIDEIHAVAQDKRGSHLALSIERLERLVTSAGHARPRRIGLSATQRPIDRVARLLVGADRALPEIVDSGPTRAMDLAIEIPSGVLGPIASNEMVSEVYDRIADLAKSHRSTLVFVNTRRLVERGAHALGERLGVDRVAAHHGSLAKELRLSAERRLKGGALSVVVATASLELGIDVGEIDLVAQIGSPRSVSTFLQRVGRSGHALARTPKGRLFALTRDQLMECAALVRAARGGRLDELRVRTAPLDILAQQVVATVASVGEISEDSLFELVRRASPYADLDRTCFEEVIEMLSEGLVPTRSARTAHLSRDRVNRMLRPRKGAKLAAMTSGGAIPDVASYAVIAAPEDIRVGTLDEDFAIESSAGDVFLLGSTSWRIRRIEKGTVRVEDAHGAAPTVPFWNGEAPARTRDLSLEVGQLRRELDVRIGHDGPPAAAAWLASTVGMSMEAATQLVEYLVEAKRVLGAIPTHETIVAERFFDEAGGMQLVVHSPFGGRINRAFGLALRKRFCRTFDLELQAAATDDGFVISLGEKHSFPLESVFEMVRRESAEDTLTQAALATPYFGTRWRWNLVRSLMLLRQRGGKRVPPQVLRMRSEDLLGAVFPDQVACGENLSGPIEVPHHPLVAETLRDCLTEVFDLAGLEEVLEALREGRIRAVAIDTPEPSALSHEILNANPYAFLDDAPLEERRTRAVSLRRSLPGAMQGEIGALDPSAIHTVEEEAAPSIRNVEELFDALCGWVVARPRPEHEVWFEALVRDRRAVRARASRGELWVASERASTARAALVDVVFAPEPPFVPDTSLGPAVVTRRPDRPVPGHLTPLLIALSDLPKSDQPHAAATRIVRGHLELSGPRVPEELVAATALEPHQVELALLALEAEGAVLRGRFRPGAVAVEWCDRRILARIHRLTVGRLRKEIEPVSPADLMRFLFRWQHVAESSRLSGRAGLESVIKQLAGFEVPMSAWEDRVLSSRLRGYRPEWLDAACYSGAVAFGRVEQRAPAEGARANRSVPVAFFPRDAIDEWVVDEDEPAPLRRTEAADAVRSALVLRGASFPSDLVRSTGLARREVDEALLELLLAGIVTADGFGGLRGALGRAKRNAPLGRWALLDRVKGPRPVEPVARRLLSRWGVVFRELLGRERGLPPWRELVSVYRRLEARGELRGGRFVTGFVGEQYALPEALEGLRAVRKTRPAHPELVVLSAVDPLNLAGITSPGARVTAQGENTVLFVNGVPVASLESGAIIERAPLPDAVAHRVESLLRRSDPEAPRA